MDLLKMKWKTIKNTYLLCGGLLANKENGSHTHHDTHAFNGKSTYEACMSCFIYV